MKTTNRKRTFSLIAVAVVAVGAILYALADRYLIEHVQVEDVSAAYTAATTQTLTQQPTAQTVASLPGVALAAETETAAEAQASSPTYDDWNYHSDTVSISIDKVVAGSGKSTVTYFVADVILADATQLSSAFAKNQFGTNIIQYTSAIAAQNDAIFAINGDYYGFREDGIIIRNGVVFRDIPARTGLAFYLDGSMKVYDETATTAQQLVDEGVWNTLSFGPALLQNGEIESYLSSVEIDTNFGNHPIQGNQPRTGVGIIDTNHFVFIVVDGRSSGYSKGVTLDQFAQIFSDLGCTEAYNLDGGGSSTMYFMGRVVNNPLGKNRERGTSDILFIGS